MDRSVLEYAYDDMSYDIISFDSNSIGDHAHTYKSDCFDLTFQVQIGHHHWKALIGHILQNNSHLLTSTFSFSWSELQETVSTFRSLEHILLRSYSFRLTTPIATSHFDACAVY